MKIFYITIIIFNTIIFAFIGYSSYSYNENMDKNLKEIKMSLDSLKTKMDESKTSLRTSMNGIEKVLGYIEYKMPGENK